jgi:hypothetical protein
MDQPWGANPAHPLRALRHFPRRRSACARPLQCLAGRVHAHLEQGRKRPPAMPHRLAKEAAHWRAVHSACGICLDGQRKHAAAQPPGAKQAGVPDACRWHVYETNPAACTDRKELAISSLAAIVMWLLIIATAIFYAAGTEMGDAAGWAVKLCQDARNFCQHPEWSGIPAALMSLVYFTVRGMEL